MHNAVKGVSRVDRNWLQVIAKYGPVALIAVFLVWFIAGNLSSDVEAMRDMLRDHISETNYYLRQICINTARDEAQRASCRQ